MFIPPPRLTASFRLDEILLSQHREAQTATWTIALDTRCDIVSIKNRGIKYHSLDQAVVLKLSGTAICGMGKQFLVQPFYRFGDKYFIELNKLLIGFSDDLIAGYLSLWVCPPCSPLSPNWASSTHGIKPFCSGPELRRLSCSPMRGKPQAQALLPDHSALDCGEEGCGESHHWFPAIQEYLSAHISQSPIAPSTRFIGLPKYQVIFRDLILSLEENQLPGAPTSLTRQINDIVDIVACTEEDESFFDLPTSPTDHQLAFSAFEEDDSHGISFAA
uniref:AlNc14C526G12047 protein n=1 Tax=Albugo laibachii Nc14 TaxID=890382 RepID=F0X0V7_9STRA|nr:AlNc14C526G12047 [Albugo laibachii Nc14]|eukprot:CCA27402.1 AlNc14C526G12047 [Albugo laibachii Nc14]